MDSSRSCQIDPTLKLFQQKFALIIKNLNSLDVFIFHYFVILCTNNQYLSFVISREVINKHINLNPEYVFIGVFCFCGPTSKDQVSSKPHISLKIRQMYFVSIPHTVTLHIYTLLFHYLVIDYLQSIQEHRTVYKSC